MTYRTSKTPLFGFKIENPNQRGESLIPLVLVRLTHDG